MICTWTKNTIKSTKKSFFLNLKSCGVCTNLTFYRSFNKAFLPTHSKLTVQFIYYHTCTRQNAWISYQTPANVTKKEWDVCPLVAKVMAHFLGVSIRMQRNDKENCELYEWGSKRVRRSTHSFASQNGIFFTELKSLLLLFGLT